MNTQHIITCLIPYLSPVREAADIVNDGWHSADEDLASGVIDIATARGWDLEAIAEQPALAVSDFMDVMDFKSHVDAMTYGGAEW